MALEIEEALPFVDRLLDSRRRDRPPGGKLEIHADVERRVRPLRGDDIDDGNDHFGIVEDFREAALGLDFPAKAAQAGNQSAEDVQGRAFTHDGTQGIASFSDEARRRQMGQAEPFRRQVPPEEVAQVLGVGDDDRPLDLRGAGRGRSRAVESAQVGGNGAFAARERQMEDRRAGGRREAIRRGVGLEIERNLLRDGR